jgi:hypothetical protein
MPATVFLLNPTSRDQGEQAISLLSFAPRYPNDGKLFEQFQPALSP